MFVYDNRSTIENSIPGNHDEPKSQIEQHLQCLGCFTVKIVIVGLTGFDQNQPCIWYKQWWDQLVNISTFV